MTTIKTAVPDVMVTENGLSVPDIADVLSGRLTDMSAALGGGASQSLSSPQGQIAQSDTEIIAQVYDKLLCLFNQINPDFSTGRMQDGIGRIYFMDRISAQGTVVTATCIGKVGTLIPAGSTASDEAGYIYQSIDDAVIPASGSVDVQFVNQTTGPIPCAAGTLNQIYRAVPGWDAVSNASPGVVGVDVESRIAFETRRRKSVARNSRNQDGSMLAALLETDGVLDAYVWSNRTGETVTVGTTNFPVLPHSVYACVYGGEDADVAEAIFRTYNPGANMNGNTSYTVYDSTNYQPPYPSYDMQWQKATPTRVYFRVSIDKSLNPPSDIAVQVHKTIAQVFNGGYEGIGKARIGATINAGKYYAPVISISPDTVGILSLEISLDGSTFSQAVTPGIDQVPTIQDADISVSLI
ncbi:baseplate J/gp47 family protein [Cronobacter sp. EKM101R]|uniref:baseplate J/gp47 family protein n=1 Tax=Cronobacter TaxID=413496 RepID=UPI0013EB6205|nr:MULTISPECIES: baseplate J/gp47 family protein [Cronobacter]KAF6596765.1 baseplate J/gp47 family protein [Cronobacter sp. EKM101R]KAF6599591.1 baseplate J/gp47 family protein [Cronobacter sp. EKM102R]MDK1185158.1 baseplate J/gp47 family protein [Cronobacter turicensis]MDK1195289.1 baseplate J/gp47 family protein [Cronobacter dublinensis]MDK1200432.1 baseplate J/gp47 family protein [Cronobacter dublinensis]